MSNSSLINKTILLSDYDERKNDIDIFTPHHMAGNLTLETCARVLKNNGASCNYAIDSDGNIALMVPEKFRSYCSSSPNNDHRAITVEVANCGGAPDWPVSDKALEALVRLGVDVCKRNNIPKLIFTGDAKGNLTMHQFFVPTACPGPYLKSKFPYIATEINRRLRVTENQPAQSGEGFDVLYRVQVGAFSERANADKIEAKLKAQGYNTYMVMARGLYKVQTGAFKQKDNAYNFANDLKTKGFSVYITTEKGVPVTDKYIKSVDEIAREIIRGDWGNGQDRYNRLTAAGFDYDTVQSRVNELLD